ncbi:hypothetical protein D3C85_1042270 [compost metagenome]
MSFQVLISGIEFGRPVGCFKLEEQALLFNQHRTGEPVVGSPVCACRVVMTDHLSALVVFGESRSGISVAQAFHHTRSLPRGLFRDGDGPLLGVKLGVTLTASCIPE